YEKPILILQGKKIRPFLSKAPAPCERQPPTRSFTPFPMRDTPLMPSIPSREALMPWMKRSRKPLLSSAKFSTDHFLQTKRPAMMAGLFVSRGSNSFYRIKGKIAISLILKKPSKSFKYIIVDLKLYVNH